MCMQCVNEASTALEWLVPIMNQLLFSVRWAALAVRAMIVAGYRT